MQINLEYSCLPLFEHLASDVSALTFPVSAEIRQGVETALGSIFPSYVEYIDCNNARDLHNFLTCSEYGIPRHDQPFTIDILDANEEADI
jgi:hypothetical protein